MKILNKQIQETHKSIEVLKYLVIGLFKYRGSNKIDLIVGVDENNIDIITFTDFGIIQQTFGISKDRGTYALFPDTKNLINMTNNPIEFNNFIKEHFK